MLHIKNGPTREGEAGCEKIGRRSQPVLTKIRGATQQVPPPLWERVFSERMGYEIEGAAFHSSSPAETANTYAAMQLYRLRDEMRAARDELLGPMDVKLHNAFHALLVRTSRALGEIGDFLTPERVAIAARGTSEDPAVDPMVRRRRFGA